MYKSCISRVGCIYFLTGEVVFIFCPVLILTYENVAQICSNSTNCVSGLVKQDTLKLDSLSLSLSLNIDNNKWWNMNKMTLFMIAFWNIFRVHYFNLHLTLNRERLGGGHRVLVVFTLDYGAKGRGFPIPPTSYSCSLLLCRIN